MPDEMFEAFPSPSRRAGGFGHVAFEHSPIGMAELEMSGRIVAANTPLCRATGFDIDQLVGHVLFEVAGISESDELIDAFRQLATDGGTGRLGEYRAIDANGGTIWADLHARIVFDDGSSAVRVYLYWIDITARRHFEHQIEQLITHDEMTGLFRRSAFETEVAQYLSQAPRRNPPGALIAIDIDGLGQINESYGLEVGDDAIISVSKVLSKRLRVSDAIGRINGDGFAILLDTASVSDAESLARGLIRDIRNQVTFLAGNILRQVSASAGVVILDESAESAGDILQRASEAVQTSKQLGGNRVTLADPVAGLSDLPPSGFVPKVTEAFDLDRFTLVAQPIIDLRTSVVNQFELLLRVVDDDGSLLSPEPFLGSAERAGRVGRIDRWVIEHAIEVIATVPDRYKFQVNIAGGSIADPHLMAFIESRVRSSFIDPSRLIFELAETSIVAHIGFANEFAHQLRRIGCKFAIDNFGGRVGSLYSLKHFPFDYLKIDGEFIVDSTLDVKDRKIIDAIVSIAQELGKSTIAQSVQNEATLEFLVDHGIDFAQGFHIGRPFALSELVLEDLRLDARTN